MGVGDVEIRRFWRWFESIADELGAFPRTPGVLDVLDREVAKLGDVSWEIGPGQTEHNALVITPDGSKKLLPVTRHIVAFAPTISGWEIHPARPPKQWDLTFSFEDSSGRPVSVDAGEWRYVLRSYKDQTFDITLKQAGLDVLTDDDRYAAAVIVLDGLLGEIKRLELIVEIETVVRFSGDQDLRASSIQVLPEHLDALFLEDQHEA